MVACCRVGVTDCSSACMGPSEGGRHYLHHLHHSLVSGQTTGREHSPSTENWIKDLLSMALPIRTRPSFPVSQSLPSGSFHKPLILLYQRADRLKTTVTEKLTNLITWTIALSNSMKLRAMPCRATQGGWVMVESSDRMRSTGEGNGNPRQYSCLASPVHSLIYKTELLLLPLQWLAW